MKTSKFLYCIHSLHAGVLKTPHTSWSKSLLSLHGHNENQTVERTHLFARCRYLGGPRHLQKQLQLCLTTSRVFNMFQGSVSSRSSGRSSGVQSTCLIKMLQKVRHFVANKSLSYCNKMLLHFPQCLNLDQAIIFGLHRPRMDKTTKSLKVTASCRLI